MNIIDLNKAPMFLTKKIELRANELMHCAPGIPEIFFSKNSTTPNSAISYDTISIDVAINNLYTLLIDFPKMQLEINGHSDSKEIDKINLAAKRSKYIADKLISLGVNKSQVVVKSYGDKMPFPNIPSIHDGPMRYTKDKSILGQRNQRVAFKILTFGFDDNDPNEED